MFRALTVEGFLATRHCFHLLNSADWVPRLLFCICVEAKQTSTCLAVHLTWGFHIKLRKLEALQGKKREDRTRLHVV